MGQKRYDARFAARPAVARGLTAGLPPRVDGATALQILTEAYAASDAIGRVTSVHGATKVRASAAAVARDWARESEALALNPPTAAWVTSAPRALWCNVNPESCAAAGAVVRPLPHDPILSDRAARAMRRVDSALDRLAAGAPVARPTRRSKRGGTGRNKGGNV